MPVETRAMNLLTVQELMARKPMSWLLDGKLSRNTLGVLYGPPKVGKSFLALRWALELANKGNHVIYLAGEGVGGLGARIRAWYEETGEQVHDDLPLFFPSFPVNIHSAGEVSKFLESIRSEEGLVKRFTQNGEESELLFGMVDLIVIDTLARMMIGADENDARDVSLSIHHMDYLRQQTGAAVLVLHHTTKASPMVERGSTALRGAADVMLRLGRRDGLLRLSVEAARDFESGQETFYELKKNEQGATLVDYSGVVQPKTEERDRVIELVKAGHSTIKEIVEISGRSRTSVERSLVALVRKGLIERLDRGVYVVVKRGSDLDTAGTVS